MVAHQFDPEMENLVLFLILIILLVLAGSVFVQAKRRQKSKLFSVSDEIVSTVYNSGGKIERIKQIGGSLELDLAEFDVRYYNAQGILDSRIASQAFDANGEKIGPLHWNRPIYSITRPRPASDNVELKSSENATG